MRQRLIIVLTIATCLSAGFQAPSEEADEFHFVVLGDSQFDAPSEFNRIIDQARRLRPAFVIQVGDLIDGYSNSLEEVEAEWQRFEKQIAPLAPVPFIAVAGNHDVFNGKRRVDPALEEMFVDRWGGLYYAFTYKNSLFVVLNSDSTEGMNVITGKQLSWLEGTLADNQAEHTFVFMHRPAFLLNDADALHELFKEHNVDRVFYGHHHHYHHFDREGIGYTMTNANGTSAARHPEIGGMPHLLQVSVRGAEVDVAVIHADSVTAEDSVIPADNYDYFALTRGLVPEKPVELHPTAANAFTFDIPLENGSRRDIRVMVSCSSDDERWQFDPTAPAPIDLEAGMEHTLALVVSHTENRVPEVSSLPRCTFSVPLQMHDGTWITLEETVTGRR